jgi:hypothetical protein
VEKKLSLVVTLVSVFLLLAIGGTQLRLVVANPFLYRERTPPPYGTKPPTVLMFAPANNTAYASNTITLILNVSVPQPSNSRSETTRMLTDVYYETDWQKGNTSVYHLDKSTPDYIYDQSWITELEDYLETLTGIPEGKHNITVTAMASGGYAEGLTYYYFSISGSSSVFFTIDITLPIVSFLSLENNVYYEAADVPLSFSVNEAASRIEYSIDGQGNVTVAGNTTLTSLSVGVHNVTVFAWDDAGNVGSSETVTFTVAQPEPFPAAPVAAASVVSIAVAGVGLLVYFRKKRPTQTAA